MTAGGRLTLGGPELEHLLPFRLHWRATGELVSISPMLRRYWGLPDGPPDATTLRLLRPFRGPLNAAQFPNLTEMTLDVSTVAGTRVLHGGLEALSDGGWLLVGRPDVRHVSELEAAGVLMEDLPAHMGLGYLLLAAEATRIAQEASADSLRLRLAAESAGRAKAEFLANMSHELRTPLTAVIGFLHLCLRHPLPAPQQQLLQKAELASQSLLTLIGDVLDVSKIEAEALRIEQRPLDLPALISRLQGLFGASAREKGLEFRVEMTGWPPPLVGDAHRLQQVLTNLLGNAIKFTSRGFVQLALQVTPLNEGEVSVEFRVRDTGIGIAAEDLPKIMLAFHQADLSTTREFGGTGLGLTISDRLVALMGGTLRVTSERAVGSEFFFTLRLPRAPTDSRGSPADAPPGTPSEAGAAGHRPAPTEQNPQALAGTRVLVVEDHPLNREVIVGIVESAGASATEATNGAEALERVQAGLPFDLVLMDVQMPVLDGLSATRRIRALPGRELLPIVGLTAHTRHEDRVRCLEAGMTEVETKPIDPDRLAAPERPDATGCPAPGSARPSAGDPDGARPARLERFHAITLDTLARLRNDLAAGDVVALRQGAHFLRGSALFLGLEPFATLCEDLETACDAHDLTLAERLVAALAPANDAVLAGAGNPQPPRHAGGRCPAEAPRTVAIPGRPPDTLKDTP